MKRNKPSRGPVSLIIAGALHCCDGGAIVRGIHSLCLEEGWTTNCTETDGLCGVIDNWAPDAVILMHDEAGPALIKRLRRHIVVGAGEDLTRYGWPSVVPDDLEVGRQAAQHLEERGFRSLAVFGTWPVYPDDFHLVFADRRACGFAEVARREGLEMYRFADVPDRRADPSKPLERFRPESVRRWLSALPKPVGILAGCDNWARLLVMGCHFLGIRIPEDVAIVGVDDDRTLCETCHPPLSSVGIPWERLGRSAAELVRDAMRGERARKGPMILPPMGVAVRRSSDTLAVKDPGVAAALAMILEHSGRPLNIAQILRKVPLTQRSLERSFKKLVGRRMTDEIRRVHVEQAKRLLSGTDMAMPAIARRSGFSSAAKLSTAFHRETGVTPSTFRRRFRLNS